MSLTDADLQSLAELAIAAARDAGEMIASARPSMVEHKDCGSSPASRVVTEVDRRSEALILRHLEPTFERFGLGLLTEERVDDESRFVADYFWSVDPLDGTLPFTEGRPGYAVSIALVARDGTPLIGVVCDPVEATVLHAIAGGGAFRDGRAWARVCGERRARDGDVLSVFADRSFVAMDDHDSVVRAMERIARDLGLSEVRLNVGAGAVMNGCGVLGSPRGCYLKFPVPRGGGSLWDFAATSCIFQELGAIATDVHGDSLDLNRRDSTFMNHRGVLFATDEELAAALRGLCAGRG